VSRGGAVGGVAGRGTASAPGPRSTRAGEFRGVPPKLRARAGAAEVAAAAPLPALHVVGAPRARVAGTNLAAWCGVLSIALLALLAPTCLAAEAPSARAAKPWSAAEHQAQLDRMQQRTKVFYELLEKGDRERAAPLWPEIERELAAFGDELQERLDQMRQEVMDRDGDLEELYRTSRWREPEIMSLVATYHLAWIRYQGAQLTGEAARRKDLLQKAVRGFSQFLLVNEVPEIYAESLYGRGLAFLDLGETSKAVEDLEAATQAGAPAVAAKARAAVEEARRRAGGKTAPSENEPEQLLARLGELTPRAAAGDASVEKDAMALARGLAARGGPWPARVESVLLEKLGADVPAHVRSSWGLALLAQLAIDRGRCADVAPLAEASAAVNDAGRTRQRPELLFLDAGCRLNAGRSREAVAEFATLLGEFPDAPRAREAAYYRFRALDVARAADPTLGGEYEEALATFLSRYPRADGAAEARYLLAELHRSRADCARAETEYAQVPAGPFAARAHLGVLECRVAALGGGKAPPERRREVLDALRTFSRDTSARAADQALVARAALLGAAVAAGATPPDHPTALALLDGFETRYPEARDLHFRALELRLTARVGARQLDGVEGDLARYLAEAPGGPDRRRTLAHLGRELAAEAERAGTERGAPATALARRVYETLARETGDPGDRLSLAELTLRAGDAPGARRLYDETLKADPTSAEALRGAARAAAAAGERDAALAYWRRALEASPPGGTAWYEARLAEVALLAQDGRRTQACELIRTSRGHATSAGADSLEARLRGMEPEVCR